MLLSINFDEERRLTIHNVKITGPWESFVVTFSF